MTAPISLIPGKTRGHRPRLQMLLHEFRNVHPASQPVGQFWELVRSDQEKRLAATMGPRFIDDNLA
jgi:hypothetical protein